MHLSNRHIISKLIPITFLPLSIYSILIFFNTSIPIVVRLMNSLLRSTALWLAVCALILLIFYFSIRFFFDNKNAQNLRIVGVYLCWNIICIVRGMFVAEIYWDWRGLMNNSTALLLPIAAYMATNKLIVQSQFFFYMRYVLPLFIIFYFAIWANTYGFFLVPISFLLLFLPALTFRQKVILIVISLIVFLSDLGARSNILKFGVPLLLLPIYYMRKSIHTKVLNHVRLVLLITPVFFFLLGISGVFNVFKMEEYLKGDITTTGTNSRGNQTEISLTSDTRTFIYDEVITSAIKNKYWLLGRTPARGNESEKFGWIFYEVTGRYERLSNEVGIANVFTWTGIVGVIIYMMVFIKASYLAINRSNSIYAKILGVYVAFRWLLAWVEDMNNFSLNYLMIWIMVGLCISHSFRDMTDEEVTIWVRGIFDKKYIRLQHYLIKKNKPISQNEHLDKPIQNNMLITNESIPI